MPTDPTCPECGGAHVYRVRDVPSSGLYGPHLLPGLGSLFSSARFEVRACADCGLMRFYADREARAGLPKARRWMPLGGAE